MMLKTLIEWSHVNFHICYIFSLWCTSVKAKHFPITLTGVHLTGDIGPIFRGMVGTWSIYTYFLGVAWLNEIVIKKQVTTKDVISPLLKFSRKQKFQEVIFGWLVWQVGLWEKRTNKQTNKQTNKETKKETNKQTKKERKKQTNKQASKQASKQTNKQTNKQTTTTATTNYQPTNQPTKQPTNQSNNQPTNQPTKQTNKQTNKQTTNTHPNQDHTPESRNAQNSPSNAFCWITRSYSSWKCWGSDAKVRFAFCNALGSNA